MNLINFLKHKLLLSKAQKSQYFKEFYEEVNLKNRVKDTTFVVFDCEATDVNIKNAHLLSIGALKVKNLEIDLETAFYEFVKSEEVKAVEIHGITKEEIEKYGKEPKEVIKDFLYYIKGSILVGFNIIFDVKLIEKYSLKYFNYPILNYKLDIYHLYKRRKQYITRTNLDKIAEEFGIDLKGRHTAIDDAYTTALIFLKLVNEYKEDEVDKLPVFV